MNDFNSTYYWEFRYRENRFSGKGSYGKFAQYKADAINLYIVKYQIKNMIDLGCGDGNQLSLFCCSNYTGYDVSKTVIQKCKETYKDDKTKSFFVLNKDTQIKKADLCVSCEVIFHLVENELYNKHLNMLFGSADKLVIIFSSNCNGKLPEPKHVKHRKFTDDVKRFTDWKLIEMLPNPFTYPNESFSNFYIYGKDEK